MPPSSSRSCIPANMLTDDSQEQQSHRTVANASSADASFQGLRFIPSPVNTPEMPPTSHTRISLIVMLTCNYLH